MLSASNLALVSFWRFGGGGGLPAESYNSQVMVFFVITVAAAEVAVGLAIIVALFRSKQTVEIQQVKSMKGWIVDDLRIYRSFIASDSSSFNSSSV